MTADARVRATTICCVRRGDAVAIAGDGQVSLGQTIAKADAVKVRQLDGFGAGRRGVLVGFAGGAADGLALLDRFEDALKATPTHLLRAVIELAKSWRTDRAMRRLEAMLIVADLERTILLSGQGDLIEPADGVAAIGSGGPYALAAARALLAHTELGAGAVAAEALRIAADVCVYTNASITSLELSGSVSPA